MSTAETANDPQPIAVEPSPEPFRTTPAEQRQIITERLSGLSLQEVAARHHVNPSTVWRICKDTQQHAESVVADWRSEMRPKAVKAVTAGLEHAEDPYKQANVGIQVLKGLGDFAGDAQVNITTLVSSAPQGVDQIVASLTTTPCGSLDSNYVESAAVELKPVE